MSEEIKFISVETVTKLFQINQNDIANKDATKCIAEINKTLEETPIGRGSSWEYEFSKRFASEKIKGLVINQIKKVAEDQGWKVEVLSSGIKFTNPIKP